MTERTNGPGTAEYGFWSDPFTFHFDPPRRHLNREGVTVVRTLVISHSDLPDQAARDAAVRHLVSLTEAA